MIQVSNATYADLVYYPHITEIDGLISNEEPSEEVTSGFGARVYIQPKFSFGKRNMYGYSLTLGVGIPPGGFIGFIYGFSIFTGFGK